MSNGTDDRRTGNHDRRGRPVYTRGPVIYTLEILSGLSALAAIISLIVTLTTFSHRLQIEHESRQRAAMDACFLIRGIVISATPKRQLSRAQAFINSTKLRDCSGYARAVVNNP